MKMTEAKELGAASLKGEVRDRYAAIAMVGGCCGSPATTGSCCGDSSISLQLGYTAEELAALPAGANLGLGCGNPAVFSALRPGQVVLDLGSGAGIDCFLAARKVGPRGQVIGVDMTPEMLLKARANARSGKYSNVEFRLGEIEHLPVADSSVDVVISNCVINLAPDKGVVYAEAYRALRPGGRLAVSDVVATRPITARQRADPSLWSSCSSGAIPIRTVKALLKKAGFAEIAVDLGRQADTPSTLQSQASLGVVSAAIRAKKPAR